MAVSMEDIKNLRARTSAGIALCKEALEKTGGDMDEAVKYVNARGDVIARLHNTTGAKIGLCKIAFNNAGQDFEKAVKIIEEKGWGQEVGASCANPVTGEGVIGVYVHGVDQRTVALAEVACNTDFVAKNETFREFAHEVAMQVAAVGAKFVSKEDIPEEKVAELRQAFEEEVRSEGKPENIIDKIVEGKLNKYFEEHCLLSQKWFKDESKTMKNLLDEYMQKIGESITIRRILLWKFGEQGD